MDPIFSKRCPLSKTSLLSGYARTAHFSFFHSSFLIIKILYTPGLTAPEAETRDLCGCVGDTWDSSKK